MSGPSLPRVVHVTADHPDVLVEAKTPVIARLVDLVSDRFDNRVISLNRKSPPALSMAWPRLRVEEAGHGGPVTTLAYHAPPAGLHHWRMLRALGEDLAKRIAKDGKPSLLIAHKLTVEGVAVERAAELLGVPYAVSIQGNTDEKILKVRRDLHGRLARIFHGAAHVFPFTPWALAAVEKRLGRRSGPITLLPCALADDTTIPPRDGGEGLVTAFHLRNARLKGLDLMGDAARSVPGARLTVLGGGSEAEIAAAKALGGPDISFAGAVANAEIKARFNAAKGFVMPSRRESFGLVFIEALFAGCPIAYPAGAAVDGYFDDCPFAVRVKPGDTASVAAAMQFLTERETQLKQALAQWQQTEEAARFTRPAIAGAFARGIQSAIGAAG